MVTIKSHTDLEQSKKLAEILPLESADMSYKKEFITISLFGEPIYDYKVKPDYCEWSNLCESIPCWSLAALLSVLHDYTLQTNTDGTVFVVCDSKKPMISDAYDNPVDACYEMILKLHELNLL